MAKIDIISGFLGAGKTTLIKKLISEAFQGEKLVIIENEFGEIDFDNRLDYMVIHIDIEDEMKNPKKYVEEHIDSLIKELENDKEIEMN